MISNATASGTRTAMPSAKVSAELVGTGLPGGSQFLLSHLAARHCFCGGPCTRHDTPMVERAQDFSLVDVA
jgi:hypothetical protein